MGQPLQFGFQLTGETEQGLFPGQHVINDCRPVLAAKVCLGCRQGGVKGNVKSNHTRIGAMARSPGFSRQPADHFTKRTGCRVRFRQVEHDRRIDRRLAQIDWPPG